MIIICGLDIWPCRIWQPYDRSMTGLWQAYDRPMTGLWQPMLGVLQAYDRLGVWQAYDIRSSCGAGGALSQVPKSLFDLDESNLSRSGDSSNSASRSS